MLPRHVLCVLGPWTDWQEIDAMLRERMPGFSRDDEYSQLSPDERMPSAFESCFDRTATDEDRQAVKDHAAVAYILSPHIEKERSEAIAGDALALVELLFQIGATAVKNESVAISHGREHWIQLAKSHQADIQSGESGSASLYVAWVRNGIEETNGSLSYSCGLHLLGWPDIEVDADSDAVLWQQMLGVYLAIDRPTRELKDGEGFRYSAEGPRRLIKHVPCLRYEEDDFYYNPFGYIRLVDENSTTL